MIQCRERQRRKQHGGRQETDRSGEGRISADVPTPGPHVPARSDSHVVAATSRTSDTEASVALWDPLIPGSGSVQVPRLSLQPVEQIVLK